MRNTVQKTKIKEYLKSVKTHPTAQMVYDAVKEKVPGITLATVYRNLNAMAQAGEILRFETGKEYRYDADLSKHQHMVCTFCGKIHDLFDPDLEEQAMSKEFHNFKPKKVSIIYYGKCKGCN